MTSTAQHTSFTNPTHHNARSTTTQPPPPATKTTTPDTTTDTTTDTAMPDAPSTSQPPSKKRKKERPAPHILQQATFRKPRWAYMHLTLLTPGTTSTPSITTTATQSLTPLSAISLLNSPLASHLGTTGAAIPLDILHTRGRDAWIRVPRQDARAVRASLSGWVGTVDEACVPGLAMEGKRGKAKVAWRVVGEGCVLGSLHAGDGGELFR